MRTFLLLLTLQSFCLTGFPQQYTFTGYSIEQGLSQSVVNCMIQDARGFIWAGTQHGLNKFNGYSFEVFTYNPSDSTSISNNWVYSLVEDKQGNFYILTKGGVNVFDRKKKSFSRMVFSATASEASGQNPYDVILSRTGLIYFNLAPSLFVYDTAKKTLTEYKSSLEYDSSVKDLKIPLMEDRSGKVWMASTRGLSRFDPATGKFSYFLHRPADNNTISSNNITALCEDREGNIWIGTVNGLNMLDQKSGVFSRFVNDPRNKWSLSNNVIRSIIQDKDGSIWIGTEGGGLNKLVQPDKKNPVFEAFTSETNGLSHNIVNCLLIDRSQSLWIGTLNGLSKTDLKRQKFRLYRRNDTPYSVDLLGNVIASIFKDDEGKIWVGNWGQGLNILDRKTGHVEHFSARFPGSRRLIDDYVHYIFQDDQKRIWIGTRNGLMIWDRNKNSFVSANEVFRQKGLPDLGGIRINKIIQDPGGNYWLATQNGVYCFNLRNGLSEHFSQEGPPDHRISSNLVYCIARDHQGLIWMATLNGLDAFDPAGKTMTHYRKQQGSGKSISDNFVISLCVDNNGDIWIGTGSGVNKFVKKDLSFRYFSQESGFPGDQVFEILEDNRLDLWFATGNGLSRLNVKDGSLRTFTIEEGLQSREFNLRAAFKSPDGEMFFGGMNGFNSFYPDSIRDNPYVPPVVLTALTKTSSSGVNTRIDPSDLTEIVLDNSVPSFTLEFVALEFTNPEKNRYSYRMEGISDQWIDIGNRRFVPFSNLPPGEYTFQVKGSNNDGVWNEAGSSIRLIINPPWFKSTLAYVIYAIDLILIIFFFVRWRLRRLMMEKNLLEGKIRERTQQIETQRDKLLRSQQALDNINKELEKRVQDRTSEYLAAKEKAESSDRLKTAFMHNISHEIRTPLNGILGFGQIMLSDDISQEEKKKYFDILQRSSDRLLNTITDYMDISLIVTGNMDVSNKLFSPVGMLEDLRKKYEHAARLKKLELKLTFPSGSSEKQFYADQELLSKVLGHLIDNAIKFTREGRVEFGFECREEELQFFVRDTGIGIPEDDQDLIFDHFVQAGLADNVIHEGSGLGLSIAKGIMSMMGGRIWLRSSAREGSVFYVAVPGELTRNDDSKQGKSSVTGHGKPLLLIAEDEESNSLLIAQIMSKEGFEVITVIDGKQAVEACKTHPKIGLILMDLKMPVMDGFEATREIKSFAPQIPIIAVTAFALSGDRKRAMEAGCDDYMTKPLSIPALKEKLNEFGLAG